MLDGLRARDRGRIRPLINATGVILHTNLGRAPLSQHAIDAMVDAAGACTVEYDLDSRQRASRGDHAHRLLGNLVGAEDALVVNNGAAALVLALTTVAAGHRVAVSRVELVEIGGAFRLPAIIEAAGVGLTEVGTTNRTRTDDYIAAIRADHDVVAILRVHPSNFRIEGFTHSPTAADLAAAATEHSVPFLHDVDSGLLHDELPLPPRRPRPRAPPGGNDRRQDHRVCMRLMCLVSDSATHKNRMRESSSPGAKGSIVQPGSRGYVTPAAGGRRVGAGPRRNRRPSRQQGVHQHAHRDKEPLCARH